MQGSISIDPSGKASEHRFDPSRVGAGKEHVNYSTNADEEVTIRISAFTLNSDLSMLPPTTVIQEPEFLAIATMVDDVECIVDTGATLSIFRVEVARDLGLKPSDGEIEDLLIGDFKGEKERCCYSKLVIYLDIGPYPIPVPVDFPVEPVDMNAALEYRWKENSQKENILGMKSVLSNRLLCFTPDFLFAFENRP